MIGKTKEKGMKLLRMLGLVGLGLFGYSQAYNVQLNNKTDYKVTMHVYTATGGTVFDTDIAAPKGDEDVNKGSVSTGGNCPTYVKLEFYNKKGKKLPPKKVKPKGEYSIDEGDIWYNLGGTWGSFYCGNLYITVQELADDAGIEIKAE